MPLLNDESLAVQSTPSDPFFQGGTERDPFLSPVERLIQEPVEAQISGSVVVVYFDAKDLDLSLYEMEYCLLRPIRMDSGQRLWIWRVPSLEPYVEFRYWVEAQGPEWPENLILVGQESFPPPG